MERPDGEEVADGADGAVGVRAAGTGGLSVIAAAGIPAGERVGAGCGGSAAFSGDFNAGSAGEGADDTGFIPISSSSGGSTPPSDLGPADDDPLISGRDATTS